jgi:beta-galactosidase
LPTLLAGLAGVEVVDVASLLDDDPVQIAGADGVPDGVFGGWYEQIEPHGAHVLALYADGDFAETPAITAHAVRAGRVLYLAGAADRSTLRKLYAAIAPQAGVEVVDLPDGVESVALRRDAETMLVLLNHTDGEQLVPLDGGKRDLLTGAEHESRIRLAPFGVALLVPVAAAVETA